MFSNNVADSNRILDADNMDSKIIYAIIFNESIRPCLFKPSNLNKHCDKKSVLIGRRISDEIDWTIINDFNTFARIIQIYPLELVMNDVLFNINKDSEVLQDIEILTNYVNEFCD